jgi:chromosome segregation ATPase
MGGGYTSSNSHSACPSGESLNKLAFDTTISLQEVLKEFYLFAGKWKPHMTAHATLDVDTMRQTIIDNAHYIEELKAKEEGLEEQNKILQAELKQLKEQNASLEKEKARLLPSEKYKKAVLDFMEEHYTNEEVWDTDDTLDSDIIKIFSNWHANKVFMDEWDYDDVMESKEELNEYRIYKKVKGEMVSSGMDNSSVARNVRSIKKDVSNLKPSKH